MGMLAPALRRHAGYGPFEDFQQRLLHAFARYVARNGRVFRFTGNLIDFIDVDNTPFCLSNVVVRCLNQLEQAVFYVFADISRFGQARCVGNGKRHVQQPGQGLGQQRFAAARRPYHDDIGFL